MSQSDGKRRIKIQRLNLDPLSNWFYSRREIGDNNGIKLDGNDPQVQTIRSGGDRQRGQRRHVRNIYTVNAGQDAADFNLSSLKNNQTQENLETLYYNSPNKYVYISPTQAPTIISFSQQIISQLLDTVDKVFIAIENTPGRLTINNNLKSRFYGYDANNDQPPENHDHCNK